MPGMATIHANSAKEAVTKLTTLPLLAGENVTAQFVVPTVAQAVDIVIHIQRDRQGHRTVREIAALSGRIENDAIEVGTVFRQAQGQLVRADAYPPKPEQFDRVGIDVASILNGGAPWA
jgi:pilus assembly protein CpaF